MNFCGDVLPRVDKDENSLENIVFSDESTFNLRGKVNPHNCKIWAVKTSIKFTRGELA